MTESEQNRDDFRKIKKITNPVAQALYNLEINRYADLGKLTPGILANLLRSKDVRFVSAQLIERYDWIGQARILADQQAQMAVPEALTGSAAPSNPSEDNQAADSPMEPGRESWNELAHFVVSFGTRISEDGEPCLKTIVFSQADQDREWEGIANGEQLVRWMLDHANLPAAESSKPGIDTTASQAQPEMPPEIETQVEVEQQIEEPGLLTVSNLWVSQVDHIDPAKRMIRVEADVDVLPEAAVFLIGTTSFMITIYLVNTQTNGSIFIETPSITVSQYDLPHAFQHDFTVPPPGRYQLYLMVGLPSAGKTSTLQQGPIVRVEG